MPKVPMIRILENDRNKRGDLFGRLMEGLFLALGYEDCRLNIHKSGREIDLEASHRTEDRRVVAECKATEDRTGGDDVNKFVGSLDAERRKESNRQTVGYFVSLAGFRETAIQQERDVGGARMIMLNGAKVIDELVTGRMIVPEQRAMELAGRCAVSMGKSLVPEERCELLAHEIGWIWVSYFAEHKQRTHFALVHADGQFISKEVTKRIAQSDESVGGDLNQLIYLEPPAENPSLEEKTEFARKAYLEYLEKECGQIQLAGLPADQDVGSRRLRLENIFIPLFLTPLTGSAQDMVGLKTKGALGDQAGTGSKEKRLSIGKVLGKTSRIAILGLPGGGKSTLLKRLAIAYAFRERRSLIDDKLPDRAWFPLLIRCRQLEELARTSIKEIISNIPRRTEMDTELGKAFELFIGRALKSGVVLLLVDGIDEISDEGARLSFVSQLCIFLSLYPNVAVVVTSREAGFRVIGGALKAHCEHHRLADFDEEDINRLTLAWHKEVIGNRPEVRRDALKLAQTICATNRVRELAQNPLLLTTLLLVKRWVGQLPTKRSILYAKAIEVLLMTWNVEVYQPLDQEEVLPQLEFLAFTMMKEGVQRITLKRLQETLALARKQMPEILGYTQIGVSELIQRVELRSSLLVMAGHQVEDGTPYPVYEFRHLTFQEYFTARAIVNGHYPDRKEGEDVLSVLKPFLSDDNWREVVPLSAVLSGRRVEPLLRYLIELCASKERRGRPLVQHSIRPMDPHRLLGACVADEIQAPPDLLNEALKQIIELGGSKGHIVEISKGKFGPILRELCIAEFTQGEGDLVTTGGVITDSVLNDLNLRSGHVIDKKLIAGIEKLLDDSAPFKQAFGCLAIMKVAYWAGFPHLENSEQHRLRPSESRILESWLIRLLPLVGAKEICLHFAAIWALVWVVTRISWSPAQHMTLLSGLLLHWRNSPSSSVKYVSSWLISSLSLVDRALWPIPVEPSLVSFVEQNASGSGSFSTRAALVLAYYLGRPWSREELAAKIHEAFGPGRTEFRRRLLVALGEPGIAQLRAKEPERR